MEISDVAQRLDRLAEALESSRLEARRPIEPARTSPDAHAMRTVLARQSLLISAVSNLAEMVGDLMAVNGLPRRAVLDYPATEHELLPLPDRRGRSLSTLRDHGESNIVLRSTPIRRPGTPSPNIPREKFGTLARRRRAVLASSLVAVVFLTILVWQVL